MMKKSIESNLLVEINKNIKKWIFMKAMKEKKIGSDEKKGVKNFMNLLLAIAAVYTIFI